MIRVQPISIPDTRPLRHAVLRPHQSVEAIIDHEMPDAFAVDHARAHGADRVWCNARIAARTLYERAGFQATSEEFNVPEIGPHYVMELRLS
jgi:hypothetical protein